MRWDGDRGVCRSLLLFFLIIGLSSCVKPAALSPETESIDFSKGSVVLLSVRAENRNRRLYQPELAEMIVRSAEEHSHKSFRIGGVYRQKKSQYNEYLVSLQLPPGSYELSRILGSSGMPPNSGDFTIPLGFSFELRPEMVVYLGRIMAVNRRKRWGDSGDGAILSSAATGEAGFFSGNFDVSLVDNAGQDLSSFREYFPVLTDYPIEKSLLVENEKNVVVASSADPSVRGFSASEELNEEDPQSLTAREIDKATRKDSKAKVCTLEQILEMKRIGLSRKQIRAACRQVSSECELKQILKMLEIDLSEQQIKAACE